MTQRHTTARLFAGALLLATALPFAARAADLLPRDEGFMKEPKSVAYRLFSLSGKSDFGLFGAFSMKNKLTQHQGGSLTFDQQFNEYFALDVYLGGGAGRLTNLADNIRQTFKFSGSGDDLADAGALMAYGQLGLRFTPIYGKLSLSSELPVHFNFYAVAGGGVALVDFNGILSCSSDLGGSSRCPSDFRQEMDVKPAFNVGGGLRFYVTQLLSIRAEVRDVVFLDQYYANVNFKTPKTNTGVATPSGLSQTPLVMVGVGFLL